MKENGSMELAWYLYLSRLTAGGVGNVISVNGKEGEVVLDAEDVGALPDTTVIPTVYNGTLTVQKNGTAIGTFSANQNENATINVVVPTKTSDLTNDSGFITGISYQMVISALGYTPYDSTNPNGYQANVIEVIKVNGTAVTITNKTVDITVPTKVSDLTNDSGFITGITSTMVTNALGYTPYDSTNPSGYQANVIETVKVNGVALTVTSKAVDVPVPTKVSDLTNDSGFITGITYSMVTTALGYTPYNATNPNGYQANVIETIKVNGTALTPTDKAVDIVIPDVSIDNSTITRNGSNQLQANAVVNQNSGIVKTWKGTLAQYNALGSHATDTVYIITDDGSDGVIVPGLIMPYAGTTVPPGYLLCDGSAISRTTYANLFAAIGTTYGAGDGNTTFNIPDLGWRSIEGLYGNSEWLGYRSTGSVPRIEFEAVNHYVDWNVYQTAITPISGCLYTNNTQYPKSTYPQSAPASTGSYYYDQTVKFDARRSSNSYYRTDDEVHPCCVNMYFVIKY